MSLEKDISQIREDLFKPADSKELLNRKVEWDNSSEALIDATVNLRWIQEANTSNKYNDEEWVEILKAAINEFQDVNIDKLRKLDLQLKKIISAITMAEDKINKAKRKYDY